MDMRMRKRKNSLQLLTEGGYEKEERSNNLQLVPGGRGAVVNSCYLKMDMRRRKRGMQQLKAVSWQMDLKRGERGSSLQLLTG